MSSDDYGIFVQASPDLRQAVQALVRQGMDETTAVRQLATTQPELFSTPADEIIKMVASWD